MKPRLRAIAIAQIAVAAVAIVDVAWAAIAARLGALSTVRALVAAIGLALPVGALVGALALAIRWGWGERRAPTVAEVVAAPVGALVWATAWLGFAHLAVLVFHAPALTAIAITLAGFALAPLGLAFFLGVRRAIGPLARRFPRAMPYALAAELAIGAAAAPWQREVGVVCAAALVALVVVARAPRWPAHASIRIVAAATAAGAIVALSPLCDDEHAHDALAGRAAFLPAVERAIAPLADVDGDGYLAVLGGGDCAGFDADRSPDGVEIAGNGIDEDCRYGDLRPSPAVVPPPPGAGAETVALVTIAGLWVDDDGAWHPDLPELATRAQAGVRFTHPVGVEGRFRDVAGVLIARDLPGDFTGEHGAFPTGGPTVPALAERTRIFAALALPKSISLETLTTQFARERSSDKEKDPAKIVAAGVKLMKTTRSFLWVHLDLSRAENAALDAAAASLVDQLLARKGVTRVVIVGLGKDAPGHASGRRPRGGPVALLGTGVAPATVDAPVGLFDVYPTLLDALGLATDEALLGASLLRLLPERDGVLGGWIDGEMAPYGPPALVRDGWLAPRLAARNAAHADARAGGGLPDDLDGAPSVIGDRLRVLGCTSSITPDRQADVTIYLQGSELFDPDDLLSFKLSSPHSGSMRGRVAWFHDAHRVSLRIDLRPVHPGTATLWLGVLHRGKPLGVSGPGSQPTFGRICNVEVPVP